MAPAKKDHTRKAKQAETKQLQESLFQFPCEFPIKIMAENKAGVEQFIRDTLDHEVDKKEIVDISIRESREANYISITAIIMAKDKAQLDRLYEAFSGNKQIKMVL